jgi:hypothetical protein
MDSPRFFVERTCLHLIFDELRIGIIKARVNDPTIGLDACAYLLIIGGNGLAYFALDFASVG